MVRRLAPERTEAPTPSRAWGLRWCCGETVSESMANQTATQPPVPLARFVVLSVPQARVELATFRLGGGRWYRVGSPNERDLSVN